jgi:hypothetical protein
LPSSSVISSTVGFANHMLKDDVASHQFSRLQLFKENQVRVDKATPNVVPVISSSSVLMVSTCWCRPGFPQA